MKHLKKFIWVGVVMIPLVIFTAWKPNDRYFEIAKNLEIFNALFKELNTYYVDEINPTELMNVGIEAMVASLDPYTNYIPEDKIEDYRFMTTGQYGGIGASVGTLNGKIKVLLCYDGYPADKAGIKPGDEIVGINGVDVSNKTMDDINALLKGQINSDIHMKVKRYGQQKPLSFDLHREKITIKSVPYYGLVHGDIGYVRLTEFTQGCGDEVRAAINDMKSRGAQKIILDLRGNPGGLLMEAISTANIFIPKDEVVVKTKGKVESWNKTYKTSGNPVDTNIPVAVLVNGGSASASEIVSGVMQDYDRGILIGQQTYGKGLVQATRPLAYNSQVKLTTAKYYTPSGRCIQKIDYAHRDAEGKALQVADSSRNLFYTRAGRKVYDGGGIKPDVHVNPESYGEISDTLLIKGLIFDYATVFYYQHPDLEVNPANFALTDAQVEDFHAWLKKQDFHFESTSDAAFANFKKTLNSQDQYEQLKPALQKVQAALAQTEEQQFKQHQKAIRELLGEEIVSRYKGRAGKVEAAFPYDPEVQKAIEVLDDSARYHEILKQN